MDTELREYLNDKFAEQEQKSNDRMIAHTQMEQLTHQAVLEKLEGMKLALWGDESEGKPGIIKKVDRIETGLHLIKFISGGIGIICGIAGSFIKNLIK